MSGVSLHKCPLQGRSSEGRVEAELVIGHQMRVYVVLCAVANGWSAPLVGNILSVHWTGTSWVAWTSLCREGSSWREVKVPPRLRRDWCQSVRPARWVPLSWLPLRRLSHLGGGPPKMRLSMREWIASVTHLRPPRGRKWREPRTRMKRKS